MTMDVEDIGGPESVEEQTEAIHEKIRHTAKEIRALLRDDLPEFVAREIKARFLEASEFASKLDEAQVKALKESAALAGAEAAETVDAALEPLDPWLAGMQVDTSRKHLADNPELWARVTQVNEIVEKLMESQGFPRSGATYGVSYREPARFIHGRYLPTLAERYWKLLGELQRVQEQASAQQQARSRAELLRRWDEA
jgi:hypothetical protein